MSKKLFLKGIFAAILSLTIATIFGSSASYAEAVITRGLFTDENDVRWEWEKTVDANNTDEPEQVSIMFYDKPAAATTVVIPSLSDVITAAGANSSLNTYYVKSANQEAQATNFASETKRTSTADVTKLDMSNTSKVQIMGIQPILNPNTEAELVFGENMVIGDGVSINKNIHLRICGSMSYSSGYYRCAAQSEVDLESVETGISEWKNMNLSEQFELNVEDYMSELGYVFTRWGSVSESVYDSTKTYYQTFSQDTIKNEYGVFSGYKLKLTNFGGFNYVGWNAFKDSTLNNSNLTITINDDTFLGEDIFAGTNITKAVINSNNVGVGLFRNCTNLTEVVFGDNVTITGDSNFVGTDLGNLDLSSTNIKEVGPFSFENAGLTSVNLNGVEKIDYHAFTYNDLTEIYLPKTINELGAAIFYGNSNLTKATIAYDTMTSGTRLQFFAVLDGNEHSPELSPDEAEDLVKGKIEELIIEAPYGEDEDVKATHMPYQDYRNGLANPPHVSLYNRSYGNDARDQARAEDAYLSGKNFKNFIAPLYFYNLGNLKKITIGEGIEYIGSGAFYDYRHDDGYTSWDDVLTRSSFVAPSQVRPMEKVVLPESLRGVGSIVITSVYNENFEMNLPQGLEFIGFGAFRRLFNLNANVDFPNLVFLGDYAFYSTKVYDIHLYDKLQYVGPGVFNDCPGMHDIVFDYDVFSQSTFPWWYNGSASQHVYRNLLSARADRSYNPELVEQFGFTYSGYQNTTLTINSITFTEKSLRPLALCEDNGDCSYSSMAFFSYISVNKMDLSKAQWEFIPIYFFDYANLGQVILPENLKSIHSQAFVNAAIREEIILPDTLEEIEDGAFDQVRTGLEFPGSETIKITKFPQSLKKIGTLAFYNDFNLTLDDFDLPNLEAVGNLAFQGATIKNIALHDKINQLGYGAFWFVFGTENITIDFDIFNPSIYTSDRANVVISVSMTAAYYLSGRPYPYFSTESLGAYFVIFEPVRFSDSYTGAAVYGRRENPDDWEMRQFDKVIFTEKSIAAPTVTTFDSGILKPCKYGEYSERYCLNEDGTTDWDNYRETYRYSTSAFFKILANEVDLSAAGWNELSANAFNGATVGTIKLPAGIEEIPEYAFYGASVENPINLPEGITQVKTEAFQYSNVEFEDAFAEGLIAIFPSAFYGADVRGDITIPESVQYIGLSAFNAGDADTHYNTVTIKPTLDYAITDNQAIFQMFWNAKMDKMVIESPMLPVLRASMENPILPEDIHDGEGNVVVPGHDLREDGEPEFHGMTMKEVEVKNIYAITPNAFEECAELEKVVFSNNQYLDRIGKYAFNNATKLKQVVFGEANNNKDINLEEYAFNNTAIESLGTTDDSGMNLAAANFYTVNEHVFSNMPSLTKVSIPNNFNIDENLANAEKNTNGSYITSFTFSDDPELSEATIGYQVSEIRDGAFLNDEKLAKLFVWGNTEIQETDQLIQDFNNTTIPKGTTIFAYSDAPAEDYANAESRNEYEGVFYALDEVLYLATNKNFVILNDDKTDFDKEGLKLYAQRRDGVILESDNWQQYTTAFPRTNRPDDAKNITFEEGRGRVGSDEADIAGTVYDAPKPFNTISLANENYANVDFEMLTMPSSENPLVIINYPDGYTGNIRKATLVSKTKEQVIEEVIEIITPTPEPEPEDEPEEELAVPDTGAYGAIAGAAVSSISIATIVVLGGIFLFGKRKK